MPCALISVNPIGTLTLPGTPQQPGRWRRRDLAHGGRPAHGVPPHRPRLLPPRVDRQARAAHLGGPGADQDAGREPSHEPAADHRGPVARGLPLGARPSLRAHAASRCAGAGRRAVPPPLRPGDALRAVARQPAHRHVRAQPPLGDQRHAARRAPRQPRRPGARGGLPAGAVRLHRHEPRPARAAAGRPAAAHLRGDLSRLRGRALSARGQRRLARSPRAPPRPPAEPRPSCSAARSASRRPTPPRTARPRSSPTRS